jgi:hypothetical protein
VGLAGLTVGMPIVSDDSDNYRKDGAQMARRSNGGRKAAMKAKTSAGFKRNCRDGARFTTVKKLSQYVPIGAEGLGERVTPTSSKYRLVVRESKPTGKAVSDSNLLIQATRDAQRWLGRTAYEVAAQPLAR